MSVQRTHTIRAVLLVLLGSVLAQVSSLIALGLFDGLGVMATSGLRQLLAAAVLLALFRPRFRGRTRAEWLPIVLFGVAMASGNMFLYLAIDRIPLGVATTIDFLGPCLVAFFGSRSLREGLLAITAFVGVVLIAGFGGPFDTLGLIFAGCAGLSFALYTLLAVRIGQSVGGVADVSLSLMFAAIFTLPFSLPAVTSVALSEWGLLLLSAAIGTAVPYTVDTYAGKLTSTRVVGVLFAFDPVVGTILGALVVGQIISGSALLGMVLVICAGAGIVWVAGEPRSPHPDTLGADQR